MSELTQVISCLICPWSSSSLFSYVEVSGFDVVADCYTHSS